MHSHIPKKGPPNFESLLKPVPDEQNGEAMKRLTDPIWQREFLGIGRHGGAVDNQAEHARAGEAAVP